MYSSNPRQSRRTVAQKRYIPGLIANLPNRRRPSSYVHAGHTRQEIREAYPHFVEVRGGFAEILLGEEGGAK